MKADLLTRYSKELTESTFVEMVVWHVPNSVNPSQHNFKYSLVMIENGVRVIGFDNERGKGDHCHIDGKELPYSFTGVDQLLEDFIAAVETRRAS